MRLTSSVGWLDLLINKREGEAEREERSPRWKVYNPLPEPGSHFSLISSPLALQYFIKMDFLSRSRKNEILIAPGMHRIQTTLLK